MGVEILRKKLGFGFTDKDEYLFRNKVNGDDSRFRHLVENEITELEANGNIADSWDNLLVSTKLETALIRNNRFYGKVRIGAVEDVVLKYHDLELPAGITDSTIISSDIGNNCAIHSVSYMANYIVHDNCILHCVDEIQATNHSKFGNGIVKDKEDPSVRVDLSVMNENGGRAILPFEDMICADAILWADRRDDKELNKALIRLTDSSYSLERGWYGEIGENSVIKGCAIIKDVKFGTDCYIKGCNKLKNLTVKSSANAPTQLGEGIELVNGIVGYGCRAFYGCKAIRFVMCENSSLKYGARLINSVLGDNSTVSCCEVLSNLIFPFHEQHHNNSFLISSLIMGQSNMAAGANIGSNHNSRCADGEMRAGRGFWPALSSTLKFNSSFSSFVIIAKGNYIHELNVKLPFSLLSDNMKKHRREIMPAYWWLYNLYALERNCAKFSSRDKRQYAIQHIETDYLAPDTVSEILFALDYLEKTVKSAENSDEVFAEDIEKSHTPVKILKPVQAMEAYRTMLEYYGIKEVACFCGKTGIKVSELEKKADSACLDWQNLGGQLVPGFKAEKLRIDLKAGKYKNWKEVHAVYDCWFKEYPEDKALNALAVLKKILKSDKLSEELWQNLLLKLKNIREYIDTQVYLTRKKDYGNSFRLVTYNSAEERDVVIGKLEDNEFIKTTSARTETILDFARKSKY